MKFSKMHGIGNDYIYIYDEHSLNIPQFAREYCKRHTGISSDGVIHIKKDSREKHSDFIMEMYNADGSMGKMCGNGIRCVGKFLYDQRLTRKKELTIKTGAGLRHIFLDVDEEDQVSNVSVNMGKARDFQRREVKIGRHLFEGTYVSVGNPHFVIFHPNPREIPLELVGPLLEKHPDFDPDGVNVEFCHPLNDGFFFRVWERGSGETLGCGTGACACFAVGLVENRLSFGKNTARLLGGTLDLWLKEDDIYMKGEAVTVFHGEIPSLP